VADEEEKRDDGQDMLDMMDGFDDDD